MRPGFARYSAYSLMVAALAASVLFRGGVYPREWVWSALAISIAGILCLPARRESDAPNDGWPTAVLAIMAVLAGWMILPLLPLPPAILHWVAPDRWLAVESARRMTGGELGGSDRLSDWAPLSLAPAATLERLLDVLPAMAAFVVALETGWWWRTRMWIAAAPVIAIAWCESALGFVQFYLMRSTGGEIGSATGTYVNRNHFAGLLEMALPLAAMGAFAVWRRNSDRTSESIWPGLSTAVLAGVAACLLMGVVISLSRMGFLSALAALGVSAFLSLVAARHPYSADSVADSRWWRWRWIVPVALPACALMLIPTRELTQRFVGAGSFESVNTDTRVAIWKDTLHLVAEHKWTGSGLGAYERGLYPFKTIKPTNTVDYAHNDYLQIAAELGIPGALLAVSLASWILWRCLVVALRHRDSCNWELSIGLAGALLAIGLHSLTDFNLYIPANAFAFAWLCGLAASPGLRIGEGLREGLRED